jgi:transketolase
VGTALGLRAQGEQSRVVVLLGDAELDEGSNHEAIAYAGATGLGNLTAVVVDNDSSTHGWPGGIASRFAVNGWRTATVDGRDHEAVTTALTSADTDTGAAGRPLVVVATVERKES